jgi:hypothetical protein
VSSLDGSDPIKVQKKVDLMRLLALPSCVFLKTTPQRDLSVLPVALPVTKARLLDLMIGFIVISQVGLETMDSGEEAFVFQFIHLEALDGSAIPLYVKAKFGMERQALIIFAAHPSRRW